MYGWKGIIILIFINKPTAFAYWLLIRITHNLNLKSKSAILVLHNSKSKSGGVVLTQSTRRSQNQPIASFVFAVTSAMISPRAEERSSACVKRMKVAMFQQ